MSDNDTTVTEQADRVLLAATAIQMAKDTLLLTLGVRNLDRYTEAMDAFSNDFLTTLKQQARLSSLHEMQARGLPKTPEDFIYEMRSAFVTSLVWCAVNGFISFNDTALASVEERAENEKAKADYLAALKDAGEFTPYAGPGGGMYL